MNMYLVCLSLFCNKGIPRQKHNFGNSDISENRQIEAQIRYFGLGF